MSSQNDGFLSDEKELALSLSCPSHHPSLLSPSTVNPRCPRALHPPTSPFTPPRGLFLPTLSCTSSACGGTLRSLAGPATPEDPSPAALTSPLPSQQPCSGICSLAAPGTASPRFHYSADTATCSPDVAQPLLLQRGDGRGRAGCPTVEPGHRGSAQNHVGLQLRYGSVRVPVLT